MSLASLSSQIYTIKSRRNVPLSTAFASIIREDLAMRYSVFNIVKNLTGSDMIATIAESKYGKKTPLQKEEESREKRKATLEKRFRQFTANSLVALNNKINTLSSITERNTTLIENLYNDLGAFRNQRKFSKKDMNNPYTKTPLKSRTVKFQIDQIRNELNALQAVTLGKNKAKKIKRAAAGFGGVAAAAGFGGVAGAGIKPDQPDKPQPPGEEEKGFGLGDLASSAFDIYSGYQAINSLKAGYRYLRRRFFPTSATTSPSAVPVRPTPTATPSAKPPVWNEGAQRWQDPQSGKFVKPPPTATGGAPGATTAPKVSTATRLLRAGSYARNFLRGSIIGEAAWQAGPGMLGRLAGSMPKDMYEKRAAGINAVSKYGIKFITGPGGTTVGFIIDGKKFDRFQDLPIEFQNLINAYAMRDTRSYESRAAIAAINENPEKYKSLLTADGRAIVLSPPPEPPPVPAAAVVAAAASAPISTKVPSTQVDIGGGVLIDVPGFSAPPATPLTQNIIAEKQESKTAVSTPKVSTSSAPPSNPGLPIDFLTFSKRMAELESGGSYTIVNDLGYLGKYQFGAMALQDVGLVKKGTTLKQLNDPTVWNISGGKQAFLNNPKLQEESFSKLVKQNYSTLKRINVITAESPSDQVAGFLAVSHLLGPGGAKKLSKGEDGQDAFGTKATSYFAAGAQTQNLLVAQIQKSVSEPIPKIIPGTQVATPPQLIPMASTSESSNSEVAGRAALAVTQTTQSTVVALAGKVAEIDKKNQLDREFPSVRNSAFSVV